jgi:hypothetical protein
MMPRQRLGGTACCATQLRHRATPRMIRKATALAAALALSARVPAQTAAQVQTASDIYAARAGAIASTFSQTQIAELGQGYADRHVCDKTYKPEDKTHWSVAPSSPVSYNSDPIAGTSTPGDWHAQPDIKSAFQWQGGSRFDAVLDVNADRYLHTSAADRGEVSLQTKFSLSDDRDCSPWNAYPYVNNKYTVDLERTFSAYTTKVDNLLLGGAGSYPFRIIDGAPVRRTGGDADYVLSFDISAGRQQATPASLNGEIALLTATLSRTFSDSWAVGLTPTLKSTWHDVGGGTAWLSTNALVVKWTPPFPRVDHRQLEIDFLATYSHNHVPGSPGSGNITDLAPSISWTWNSQP